MSPTGPEALAAFPSALRSHARLVRLGPAGIPALLAHPDWSTPAPVMLWMHGRTASKELDPGRYLRWIRAGIAACAIDLPGHGERADPVRQRPDATLGVMADAVREIDGVVEALGSGQTRGLFDTARLGLGGMSLGGMCTLRRLCEPHHFTCAAVEGTTGWLEGLYFPARAEAVLGPGGGAHTWDTRHPPDAVSPLDPLARLDGFAPLPLLALHSRADRTVPFAVQEHFLSMLAAHYRARGAEDTLIEIRTWDQTGAPDEHVGFGRVSHEAKTAQTEFLVRHLGGTPS